MTSNALDAVVRWAGAVRAQVGVTPEIVRADRVDPVVPVDRAVATRAIARALLADPVARAAGAPVVWVAAQADLVDQADARVGRGALGDRVADGLVASDPGVVDLREAPAATVRRDDRPVQVDARPVAVDDPEAVVDDHLVAPVAKSVSRK
jgi:hypothetical protein